MFGNPLRDLAVLGALRGSLLSGFFTVKVRKEFSRLGRYPPPYLDNPPPPIRMFFAPCRQMEMWPSG